ncbi:MAG: restriction endonuclease subunit S [Muribaculaceae bacterium]|nr:restriction endonuclease subunit S [Muribaculaceae bacterium]
MKYISTVPFSGLFNWSVQYLNDSKIAFSKAYPMMRIGEFLKRNKTAVTIQDGVKYKRVTIKVRNGGVVPRDEVMGENIGTKKQFLVSKGQFILSKIDARNGAMGIIPTELDGAVVTQDFLPYDIDTTKVNPQYFVLVCTTKQFIAFCQSCSSGTTNRQRVDEAQFLNIKVPVPSLEEQNKLVEEYNKQLAVASDAELLAIKKHRNINSLLFSELGVKISKDNVLNGLSTVTFSALDRWDIAYLQNTAKYTAKYKSLRFENCIEHFMKGFDGKSLRMETYKTPTRDFHYIGMEHIEKATGQLIDAPIVKGSQIKSQTVAIPNGYFIYGKLRPYLNKYWYNNTNWDNIVCSSELFVFRIKDCINTRFFEVVLGSDIIQEQIADLTSGARMPRITEEVFMNIQIPIPPLDVQKDLADQIDKITNEIKELRNSALQKRTIALKNFETQIFE